MQCRQSAHSHSTCTGKKRTFPEISFHEMSTNIHLNAQGNVGKGKITGKLNAKEILTKHRKGQISWLKSQETSMEMALKLVNESFQ